MAAAARACRGDRRRKTLKLQSVQDCKNRECKAEGMPPTPVPERFAIFQIVDINPEVPVDEIVSEYFSLFLQVCRSVLVDVYYL